MDDSIDGKLRARRRVYAAECMLAAAPAMLVVAYGLSRAEVSVGLFLLAAISVPGLIIGAALSVKRLTSVVEQMGFCSTCGYNLTCLREPCCPECGTPFERAGGTKT